MYFWNDYKNIYLISKYGYIKGNTYLKMNFKERGITVGDLLIILLVILTSTTLVKSFNKDKKETLNNINREILTNKKTLLSTINLNKVSV